MVRITIVFGLLWLALGAGHYYATTEDHWMSVVVVAMGMAMLVLGLAALKASFRKNAMHAAALIGVAGLLWSAPALVTLIQLVLKDPGLVVRSVMALLCGTFVVLAVKSFVDARRGRATAAVQPLAQPLAGPPPEQQE